MAKGADKDTVFAVIDDLVIDFLVNHRKEDNDLPLGEIESLIEDEAVTVEEIVDRFRDALEEALEDQVSELADEDEEDSEDDEDSEDEEDED